MLRLASVLSTTDAARMGERLWETLARAHAIHRGEPATWTVRQPTGFQALTRSGAFDALGSVVLASALDALLGEKSWERPEHWGTALVTFPTTAVRWDVPSRHWHLDFPVRGQARPLFAVRILACIDTVAPQAGGTFVLAGSHQLVERLVADGAAPTGGHSRDVRHTLMRMHPWLQELWSEGGNHDRIRRFMVEGADIDGVTLRVLQLSGEPGDAFLMHPWQFHAPAPNCGASPRLMLSQSVMRARWFSS